MACSYVDQLIVLLISQCIQHGLNSNQPQNGLTRSGPAWVYRPKLIHAAEKREREGRKEGRQEVKQRGLEGEENSRRWEKPSVSKKNSDFYLLPCSLCDVVDYWLDLSWKWRHKVESEKLLVNFTKFAWMMKKGVTSFVTILNIFLQSAINTWYLHTAPTISRSNTCRLCVRCVFDRNETEWDDLWNPPLLFTLGSNKALRGWAPFHEC